MKRMLRFHPRALALLAALALFTACQPQPEQALPTLIDLQAIGATDTAATAAAAGTVTALAVTNRPPTLPPTWTPSPAPTTAAPLAATAVITPTAEARAGTLFFIFNGDSIVRLKADGSFEDLLVVGGAPADLALSPDGRLLAYVGQAGGSAREIFVIDPFSPQSSPIRMSCVGFARALSPAWTPDSAGVAFAASQTSDGPLGIYVANVAGANNCPTGNQQRQLVQLDLNELDDLTWNPAGTLLFFASRSIYGLNVNGELFPPLTFYSGYGPDTSPAHHPVQDALVYLRTERDDRTGRTGGTVYEANTAQLEVPLKAFKSIAIYARRVRWSSDGSFLLLNTDSAVWVQGRIGGTALTVVEGTRLYPDAVFSPDAEYVAYLDGGRDDRAVAQVFIVSRRGGTAAQITAHQEGSISDLVWSPY